MDLPVWANLLLLLIAIWIAVVVVLVLVGRVFIARELALLVPNLVRLFGGLLRDARVPLRANPMLGPAVAASVLLVLGGVYLPPLVALLGTDPLATADLTVALLAAAVPAVVAQALVFLTRGGR